MGGPIPSQFKGQGEPGDLLLEIDVEPSRLFRREGQDIVVSRDIDFTDAILGTPLRSVAGKMPSCGLIGRLSMFRCCKVTDRAAELSLHARSTSRA